MELSDLKSFDILWFEGETGFGIDLAKKEFTAFSCPPHGLAQKARWDHQSLPLSDLREVTSKVGIPSEITMAANYGGMRGGARQAGEGIGMGIKNAMERSKAKRQNGLEFRIRSTTTPSFFAQVVDDKKRAQLFEAVSQVLETGTVDVPVRHIPDKVSAAFYTPPRKELEEREAASEARRKSVQKYLAIGCAGIAGMAGVFGLWAWASSATYKSAVLNGEDMTNAGVFRCALLTTGHSFKPERSGSVVLTAFTAEIEDANSSLFPSHAFERGDYLNGPRSGPDGRTLYSLPSSNRAYMDATDAVTANLGPVSEPDCG